MIASLSRALAQDLRRSMNEAEFDKALADRSTKSTGLDSQDRGLRGHAPTPKHCSTIAVDAHARWRERQRARNATQHPTTRPRAPNVAARRRAARQRWRERQRIRVAAQRAAAVRYEGAQTPDGQAREAPS
jgi:hypothetical protein